VVATKTFTCTAVAFALLAIHLGRLRDLSTAGGARLLAALKALPAQVESILAAEAQIAAVATAIASATDAYFVGRAAGFAVALEGALKLKELSYLHAEAYPASELRHGPLALISPATPTVVVLAYHVALAKGRDIDQPRNLAKSVTVE
jgi:glucosamine--fructose-6-phosphate aminotransferase (isomerizing)